MQLWEEFGSRVLGFRALGFTVWGSRIQGLGFGVQGLRDAEVVGPDYVSQCCRVQDPSIRLKPRCPCRPLLPKP